LDPHPAKLMLVLKQLDLFHKISYWRTSEHWSTVIENELKAKYVGLENPGCICYLNSLLQQLFMTEDFRDNVYALNLEQSSVKEESRF
jgi:ubiquitin C-terminal hydrolase